MGEHRKKKWSTRNRQSFWFSFASTLLILGVGISCYICTVQAEQVIRGEDASVWLRLEGEQTGTLFVMGQQYSISMDKLNQMVKSLRPYYSFLPRSYRMLEQGKTLMFQGITALFPISP